MNEIILQNLEQQLNDWDIKSVRISCEKIKLLLVEESIGLGYLEALCGSLNIAWKDIQVTEIVLSAIASLGSKINISNNRKVNVCLLLRQTGVQLIIKASSVHITNTRVQFLSLQIMKNIAIDHIGSRSLYDGGAIEILSTMIIKWEKDRYIISSCLYILSCILSFNLAARSYFHAENNNWRGGNTTTNNNLNSSSSKKDNGPTILKRIFVICIENFERTDHEIYSLLFFILSLLSTSRLGGLSVFNLPDILDISFSVFNSTIGGGNQQVKKL